MTQKFNTIHIIAYLWLTTRINFMRCISRVLISKIWYLVCVRWMLIFISCNNLKFSVHEKWNKIIWCWYTFSFFLQESFYFMHLLIISTTINNAWSMRIKYINKVKFFMNKRDYIKLRIYTSIFLYLALSFVKWFSCARLRICIIIYI